MKTRPYLRHTWISVTGSSHSETDFKYLIILYIWAVRNVISLKTSYIGNKTLTRLRRKNNGVFFQDSLWQTPLMLAAKHAHQFQQVMRLLINAGSDVNIRGGEQRTVLHYAAGRGINVQLLLNVGVDPHAQVGN